MTPEPNLARLRGFVAAMTRLVGEESEEPRILARAKPLLADLIATDDWLPEECAQPHPLHYQQYLLHCDPLERFSVVSFVWGPGQRTPIHDHTVWGLVGVLRGAEEAELFDAADPTRVIGTERMEAGAVEAVSPTIGDIHRVANALADRASVSIHVYGANIGAVARHVFDAATGAPKRFVSGYANAAVPNLWRRVTPGIQG
jgi:predicted metal-dependent enzyme (double-stranded beta helix superfamily)